MLYNSAKHLYDSHYKKVALLLSGKAKTNLSHAAGSESTTTSITGLKPSYLDGQIGIGIEYGLNRKFSIGIRPNVRLALTPINKAVLPYFEYGAKL